MEREGEAGGERERERERVSEREHELEEGRSLDLFVPLSSVSTLNQSSAADFHY